MRALRACALDIFALYAATMPLFDAAHFLRDTPLDATPRAFRLRFAIDGHDAVVMIRLHAYDVAAIYAFRHAIIDAMPLLLRHFAAPCRAAIVFSPCRTVYY